VAARRTGEPLRPTRADRPMPRQPARHAGETRTHRRADDSRTRRPAMTPSSCARTPSGAVPAGLAFSASSRWRGSHSWICSHGPPVVSRSRRAQPPAPTHQHAAENADRCVGAWITGPQERRGAAHHGADQGARVLAGHPHACLERVHRVQVEAGRVGPRGEAVGQAAESSFEEHTKSTWVKLPPVTRVTISLRTNERPATHPDALNDRHNAVVVRALQRSAPVYDGRED
jgi:hypothetical protein